MPTDWKKEKRNLIERQGYDAPFKIKEPRIIIPIQTPLSGFEYCQLRATTHGVGDYYEALTRGIFGGAVHHSQEMEDSHNGLNGLIRDVLKTIPDLTDHHQGIYWESKGLSLTSGDLKLYDKQMRRYMLLQDNRGLIQNPRILFCAYAYSIGTKENSIQKQSEGKLEKIISLLAGNTMMAFFLPLSLILHLHKKSTRRSTHKRRRDDGSLEEYPMARLRPKELLCLMQNPEEHVKSLHLRLSDYEFYRGVFPERVTINKHKVAPFPILLVKDARHEDWLKRFHKLYYKDIQQEENEMEDEAIEADLLDFLGKRKDKKEGSEEQEEGYDVTGDEVPF